MATIGWNENSPANSDPAGSGDDEIRSLKSNLRGGLDTEHLWPSAGGDAGKHRYGSARVYVGAGSQVSSDGTDGRLMLNSADTTLFYLSGSSVWPIGGFGALLNQTSVGSSVGTYTTPFGYHTSVQMGKSVTTTSGIVRVSFGGSGYSGAPMVLVCPTDILGFLPVVKSSDKTGFICWGGSTTGAAFASGNFNWVSIGTVATGQP